jgi:hypothetical protein
MLSEYGDVWGIAVIAIIIYLALLSLGAIFSYTIFLAKLNYPLLLIYIITLVVMAYCADIIVNLLLAAGLSGIVQEPQTIRNEVKTFFSKHFRIVALIALYSSLPFLFLANVPIFGNGLIFLGLIALFIIMGFNIFIWNIKGEWTRRLISSALIFLLLATIGRLIPNSTYIKVFGTTPAAFFDSSKEDDQADKLDEILKTLKKNPSDEIARAKLKEIQDEMNRSSLLGKTVSMGEKIKDALTTPAPTASLQAPASTPTPAMTGKVDRYVIPANINTETIQVGEWSVYPAETAMSEIWSNTPNITGGSVIVSKEAPKRFFPPLGAKETILTRKK